MMIGRIVATYYNAQQINISNLPEGFIILI